MPASETPEPPGAERSLRNTTRNPRRRQRQSDSESLKTAPRRKRSKLNNDTFAATAKQHADGGTIIETVEEAPMKVNGRQRRESTPLLGPEAELTVRGGKKQGLKRVHRSEGGTTLTQNLVYSVKSLPSTPKELKVQGETYRGSLCKTINKALAITNRSAYIWDYTAHSATTAPRVFDLPFQQKSTDPLPYGALVTNTASTEVGLLLLSAVFGKVVFYDSIDRAASLSLFQSRGVVATEGSLGSFLGSETVVDLKDAGTAGFVVVLSTGRLLQLTLRDASGKPKIQSQFLRTQELSNGGIFGSIKGMLGAGAWKRGICAVHTRALSQRGLVQVIGATEQCEIQTWSLDWSGHYNFQGSFDFREALQKELTELGAPELEGRTHQISIQDFAVTSTCEGSQELVVAGSEDTLEMTLLLKVGDSSFHNYVLANVVITESNVRVARQLILRTYLSRGDKQRSRPRLTIPTPGHTAFVVFENAVTLAATVDPDLNTPDAQLQGSFTSPDPFEDTVYLRQDEDFILFGADGESSRAGHASIIAFCTTGLVRFQANDPTGDVERSSLSIKAKLEEAIFYGSLQPDNMLEFTLRTDPTPSMAEVEAAALSISREILTSESSLITIGSSDMESNLAYRAQALSALLHHVRRNFPPLGATAKWQLLWDAERLSAGKSMWIVYQDHLAASRTSRISTVLEELSQPQWFDNDERMASCDDPVRKVFLHKLDILDKILTRARTLARVAQDSKEESHKLVAWISEVDDLWIQCLDTAYAFRSDQAAMYGIPSESLQSGVMRDASDYVGIPEPWTATGNMLKASTELIRCARQAAKDVFEIDLREDESIGSYVRKIAEENASLLRLSCNIFEERVLWCGSRDSAREQDWAKRLRLTYEKTFYENCRALAEVGQAEAGMELAEYYQDMHTLTEMVVAETQYLIEYLNEPESEGQRVTITEQLENMNLRVKRYFDRFGDAWANAFFDQGFGEGKAGFMLSEAQSNWPSALTRYLRMQPDRARLSWMNDVSQEHDYLHASEALDMVAKKQETSLWNKKVEFSLSKLALMAFQEQQEEDGGAVQPLSFQGAQDAGLTVIDVQEKIYGMFLPELISCLDEQVELETIMNKWGKKHAGLSAITQLLEACVSKVITHQTCSVEELIDILTLIDFRDSNTGDEDVPNGKEYYLALVALNAAAPDLDQAKFDTLLRIIWKRCYVHDDWVSINSKTAQKKSDQEVKDALRRTAPWRTLYAASAAGLLSDDAAVRPVHPHECFGAGCSPEDLRYRFPSDDVLQPILADQKIQDENLQQFVTDRRLDNWIRVCMQDAKSSFEAEAEEQADRLLKERAFESDYNEQSHEVDGVKGNGNGHFIVGNGVDHVSYADSESGVGD
ncbi:hypothetical protein K431DRAFT_285485 [Polychaeton citri CBS 116435]|uniref:Nucleoporin n=1 Tax=Polychaeton citri CBS 116435 TaxID=1314669 RepID=A0A9P4UQ89_9PEZI|nr:hypothetical protein K431DRAFT_285485 [Polychaeton citri CBS 116435]